MASAMSLRSLFWDDDDTYSDDDRYTDDSYSNAGAYPDLVGLAALAVWAYVLPHMYVEYSEYKMALDRSPRWGKYWNSRKGINEYNKNNEDASRTLARTFILHAVLGSIVYLGCSSLISWLTVGMDRRAADIETGASRLFAGIAFFVLSLNLAQWLGLYYSISRQEKLEWLAKARSLREIRFSFSWSLWGQLSSMFFFNLYFSCRTDQFTYLFGFLAGLGVGGFLIMYAYLLRTSLKRYKRCGTIFMVLCLFIVSIITVFVGVFYIETTWAEDSNTGTIKYGNLSWTAVMTSAWGVVCLVSHIVAICITRHKRRQQAPFRYTSQVFKQTLTADVAALAIDAVTSITPRMSRSNTVAETDYTGQTSREGRDGDELTPSNGRDGDKMTPSNGRDGDVTSPINSMIDEDGVEGRVTTQQEPLEGPNDMCPDVTSQSSFRLDPLPEDRVGRPSAVPPLDGIDEDLYEYDDDDDDHECDADSDVPSYATLCTVKLCERCGCCKCCNRCKPELLVKREAQQRRGSIVQKEKSTWWWMFADFFKSFLWYTLSAFALYLTIVNIGATKQQTVVSASLGGAFRFLYPPNYKTGPMCAWDEASPQGDIRTFDSLAAVKEAKYSLIHCGACGACSNWNDLTLQWTTRKVLAKESKKCAQKSLFGSADAVQNCNEGSIGFTPACAECWTVDELCASQKCFWIFLQSVIIDAVSDFRVGFDDITSATCDEALCGPKFVPCSGATRRRMNIKSDIERPLYQQCTPIDTDWSAVFQHP